MSDLDIMNPEFWRRPEPASSNGLSVVSADQRDDDPYEALTPAAPSAPRPISREAGAVMLIEHALAWAARGFRIFPVQPGSKVPPKGMLWRAEATSDPAKIRAWWAFNPNYNYGVAGGDGWLIVDVDAGKNGFASLLDVDLPDTLTVKTPGGGLHLYYRGPDVANSVDRVAPGIDIRSKGGYVIGPGSVFDDAEGKKGYKGAYTLIEDRQAAAAPAGFILQCGEPKQRDRAAAVSVDDPDDIVFAIHYLEKDAPASIKGRGGNNTAYAVAARVMEIGVSPETALALMLEHWNHRCPPGWAPEKLKVVIDHAATYMNRTVGSGGVSALKDEAGAPVTLPASPLCGPLFDPWREFITPLCPAGILPETVERFATGQSGIMGACRSALAMAAFAALSGAVDHRTSLRLMRHGGWRASPRLWTLLAGPPSSKKTPIMSAALAPLKRLEARRQKAWRDECARVPEGVQKPKQPERYLAGDTTIEALAAILARQDRGILVERDEIAGWIGGMEKYNSGRGGAADRAFWLEAFNGSPFTVDRVTRSSISVANLSASIIGGIQPARLAELQGLQSDGLLQRFAPVFVTPGHVADDRPTPPDGYAAMIEAAASLTPMEFTFDDDGLALAARFRQRTYDLQAATENAQPGFAQFVGKLDGLFGTFCLLFHVAEGLEPGNWVMERVNASTAARVEQLFSDFLLPHAFEFYGVADHAVTDKLRKIASWVLTQGSQRVTARDMMREISCLRGMDAWAIGRALGPLIAGGWLEPEKPGPDNRAWHVSPAVAFQFAQRREDEERRKQELALLMKSPRRAAGTL